jgi:hypothetical protein
MRHFVWRQSLGRFDGAIFVVVKPNLCEIKQLFGHRSNNRL